MKLGREVNSELHAVQIQDQEDLSFPKGAGIGSSLRGKFLAFRLGETETETETKDGTHCQTVI
jgi:hypothetical protein